MFRAHSNKNEIAESVVDGNKRMKDSPLSRWTDTIVELKIEYGGERIIVNLRNIYNDNNGRNGSYLTWLATS